MDADADCVLLAVKQAPGIYTAAAFGERYIVIFWYQEFCIYALMLELCCDAACDFQIVDAFEEFSVRGAFSGGVDAVSVVDEDFHLCLTVCGQSARDG